MRHRILLDTDMGSDVDDALCLALALASPEIDLVAVTTVSRDTAVRARVTKRLLELAGRGDIPVYAGEDDAHTEGRSFAWTGGEGDGILEPGDDPRIEPEPATRAIARLLRDDDVEIVAVGPMTNVATVLADDPSLASRIRRLTIMGGHIRAIRYGGFTFPPGVDYNLCSDPDAAMLTLRADVPTRLVTGDVTLQTWLREEDLARLEACDTPFHRSLTRAIRIWTPIQKRIFRGLGADMEGDNAAFLHDPLTFACVADESFCTFQTLAIEPTIQDGVFRTLERPANTRGAREMRVATAVDAARFRAHFVTRLLRLGDRSPEKRGEPQA